MTGGLPCRSLSVVIHGPKRGEWFDHEAGAGGGAFGLVERVIGKAGARAWALDWLGIEEAPRRDRRKDREHPAIDVRPDAVCEAQAHRLREAGAAR